MDCYQSNRGPMLRLILSHTFISTSFNAEEAISLGKKLGNTVFHSPSSGPLESSAFVFRRAFGVRVPHFQLAVWYMVPQSSNCGYPIQSSRWSIPSGKLTVCYRPWPFIDDLPRKNGDVPVRELLNYQRVIHSNHIPLAGMIPQC